MSLASDVRRAAMDLLARREHSLKELQDKLLTRFLKYQKLASPTRVSKKTIDSEYSDFNAVDTDLSNADLSNTDLSFRENTLQNLNDLVREQTERLRDEGLQSNDRMAEAYIRARSNRGHGPQKIALELRNRGIGASIVEKSLRESGIDWVANIKAVSTKKFGRIYPDVSSNPALSETLNKTLYKTLTKSLKAKRNRFLLQRGFSYELIAHLDD